MMVNVSVTTAIQAVSIVCRNVVICTGCLWLFVVLFTPDGIARKTRLRPAYSASR